MDRKRHAYFGQLGKLGNVNRLGLLRINRDDRLDKHGARQDVDHLLGFLLGCEAESGYTNTSITVLTAVESEPCSSKHNR